MLRGLDASAVQGVLPFKLLGPEYRFCILKGQQGNDGFDPLFWRNLQGCKDHGIVPGMYLFTYPLPHLDPKKQAQIFFEQSRGFGAGKGELPPFIDFEWPEVVPSKPGKKGWKEWGCSPQQLSDWQAANCEEVTRLWGVKPIIYTYDWWFAAIRDGAPGFGFPRGADVSWAANYDLWMAWYVKAWPKAGDKPKIPEPWREWAFWQWDGNGGQRLPNGIDADFCVFNGDEDALQHLAGLGPETPTVFDGPTVTTTTELVEAMIERYRAERDA